MVYLIGFIWVLIDQLSKYFITNNLFLYQSIPLIKDFLSLTLIYNTGIAFGLFKNKNILFLIFNFLIIVYFVFLERRGKVKRLTQKIGFGLILGGAIGNLIDRIRFGYVIDFIDFHFWPVFNIADVGITIGAVLFLFSFLGYGDKNK